MTECYIGWGDSFRLVYIVTPTGDIVEGRVHIDDFGFDGDEEFPIPTLVTPEGTYSPFDVEWCYG